MKSRKEAKKELLNEISTEGFSLDVMDTQINIRVNAQMLKVLRDHGVNVSLACRIALTDIASQLMETRCDYRQPDMYAIGISRKHD